MHYPVREVGNICVYVFFEQHVQIYDFKDLNETGSRGQSELQMWE